MRFTHVRGRHAPNRRSSHPPMRFFLASLTVTLLLALPGAALAAGGGDAILRDCTDNGKIDHTYTKAQYDDALRHLPADVQEYTNCQQLIHDAAIASAGKSNNASIPPPTGGGGSSGSGSGGGHSGSGGSGGHGGKGHSGPGGMGSQHSGLHPNDRGGNAVPASSSAGGSGGGGLPTPLLIVLILVALAAIGGAGWLTRARWLPAGASERLGRVLPRLGRVLPRRQP